LMQSIVDIGLLHPVVITPDGVLIAGQRRLEAHRRLGRPDVPVRVIDLDQVLRGEREENVLRKDFTPTEKVAIAGALWPVERAAADERRAATQFGGSGSGKLPEPAAGQSRDKVARAVGWSGRTLEKARAVVAAAEAEPALFGDLLNRMDETGKVDAA